MLQTLQAFGIAAHRKPGAPGVWSGERKLGSIGVHVKRWVSLHGLALNVDVDQAHTAMIRPCGLPIKLASMIDFRETVGSTSDVLGVMLPIVERVLGRSLVERTVEELRVHA